MTATVPELNDLAAGVTAGVTAPVLEVACLVCMSRSLFRCASQQRGVDLEPLLQFQSRMIVEYVERNQLSAGAVRAAIDALERAGATAGYLEAIPE